MLVLKQDMPVMFAAGWEGLRLGGVSARMKETVQIESLCQSMNEAHAISLPRGSKHLEKVLGPKYYTYNGCWGLTPSCFGTWTLWVHVSAFAAWHDRFCASCL